MERDRISDETDRELKSADAQPPSLLGRLRRSRTAVAWASLVEAIMADAADVARNIRERTPGFRKSLASAVGKAARIGARAIQFAKSRAIQLGRELQRVFSRGSWTVRGGIVALAVFLALGATLVPALHDLPAATLLAGSSAEPSIILETSDGQLLSRRGPFKEADLASSAFPETLVKAVLAIEDRRFYRHWGLDPRAIVRALHRNVSAGQVVEGGSTITQQLVKILNLERDRTLRRKLREAVLAVWLDLRLSKDEILALYLNNVYLGAGATGMPAAARLYFDKAVRDLTLAEAALLAGLIKAPSQLNPLRDIDAARERAAVVLASMIKTGAISETEARAARERPAALGPRQLATRAGTWFADWAFKEAAEIAGAFRGTIRVRTTLHPRLQSLAERVVSDALAEAGEARGASQAALVALRPDGAVLAMVGGRSYGDSQFNRAAEAMRQPGSVFKLFVYYAALRAGKSPRDRVEDAPIELDGWRPENFDGRYYGRVSLAEAFARSLNSATVRLALEVGLDQVIGAARELGLDAPLTETPSLALGTSEVSLLDLTGAYASVRAGVAPIEPWGISGFGSDDQARLFALGPPVKPQLDIRPYQQPLVGMLKLVVDRGTGRSAALDSFAAGKTGTSQNHKDAWFVGFNEALIVGVWVGNDDGTPMDEVTGGSLPAVIWRNFILGAAELAGSPASSSGETEQEQAAGGAPSETQRLQCNYRACARAYRSFRASDCTYQPYRGRRKICER